MALYDSRFESKDTVQKAAAWHKLGQGDVMPLLITHRASPPRMLGLN